jgi:CheY-like chemotaxis protein
MAARAHVLIVDDDPIVGQTFGRMLTVSGFDAMVTESTQSAIEAAAIQLPDVILTDLRMPMSDGMELITRLRRDPRLREVPVAVITGDHFLTEEFLAELRHYGAAVRFKPLFMNDLLALVEGLLASGHASPR